MLQTLAGTTQRVITTPSKAVMLQAMPQTLQFAHQTQTPCAEDSQVVQAQ